MRIGLYQMSQETDSFNPVLTTLSDFADYGLYEGAEMLEKQRGSGTVGGYIAAVEASGLTSRPCPSRAGWRSPAGASPRKRWATSRTCCGPGWRPRSPWMGSRCSCMAPAPRRGLDDVEGHPSQSPARSSARTCPSS